MNKKLIVSVSRKYLSIMLVVGSLLLIASNNTNYSTTPSTHSGSVVTFLTPKSPSAFGQKNNTNDTDVSDTTNTSISEVAAPTDTSIATNTSPKPVDPATPGTQGGTADTPPSDPSAPANDDTTDTSPYSRCGSCRPPAKKTSPQMMCPQYMACTY